MDDLLLYQKLSSLPEDLKQRVADFIDTLTKKNSHLEEKKKIPKFGSAKGMFVMSPDFDEPLEDFIEYMH